MILLGFNFEPILVFAQGQDYLYIFGSYDGVNYTIDSIEQRTVLTDGLSTGDYEIKLFEKGKIVGQSSFDISKPGPVEVFGEGEYIEGIQKQVIFTTIVPLNVSVDVNQAKLQLLKFGQVLLENELTGVPIIVLSVSVNELRTLERIESERTVDRNSNLFVYSLIIIGLLLVGWYLWKRKNMVKLNRDLYHE